MVVRVGGGTSLDIQQLQGNETDTKPTLTANNTGSTYYEVNGAKQSYIWHVDAWYVL